MYVEIAIFVYHFYVIICMKVRLEYYCRMDFLSI